jgi:hypothetical protein
VLSWRTLGIVIVLTLVVGGLILTLTDGESSPQTVALGYAPLVATTPAPVAVADAALWGGVSSRSALVMIQGGVERRLTVWPLNKSTPPQEVDRYVDLWLLPSPDGTHVLYRTEYAMMVLDVAARHSTIVGELPPDCAILSAQWSPDGRSIAYVVETRDQRIAYYTRHNGTQPAEPMMYVPAGLPIDVAWLPPARPITIYMRLGPVGGLEAHYQLYEPDTGDKFALSPDVPVIQPFAPYRSPTGAHQLLQAGEWNVRGKCATGALYMTGDEWVYLAASVLSKNQKVAFAIQDLYLDDAVWLDDGRIVFRGLGDESCAPGKTGIYIGEPQQEPARLVQATVSTFVTTSSEEKKGKWGLSYALSPDQTLIAWTENNPLTRQATVYLKPIDGGGLTRPLFDTVPVPANAPAYTFEDHDAILDFIWLP